MLDDRVMYDASARQISRDDLNHAEPSTTACLVIISPHETPDIVQIIGREAFRA